MLKEFRDFISKGNVIDLAVAVIIGGAFGAIIDSIVNDILMPIIGVILGGLDFTSLSLQVGQAVILYGNFIQATVNFLIIALALFIVMHSYNKLQGEGEEGAPPPELEPEVVLLTEIRDLLKERN